MKPFAVIYFLLFFTLTQIFAQTAPSNSCTNFRYRKPIFNNTTYYTDLVYVKNIPQYSGTSIFFNEQNTQENMVLDVRIPANTADTLAKRPVMIWAHGGGFIIGDENHDDMQGLMDTFAQRGYVTASIRYRQGMNVSVTESAERAVYRGIQDGSAAVRYFKENAAIFKIDTNLIFFGGSSAGAFIAIHLAYLAEANRPTSTYNLNTLNYDANDLGCIRCNNIEKISSLSPYTSTSVPAIFGSTPQVIMPCWGAIIDTNYINSPPDKTWCIMFHGTIDPIVPYNCGYPFTLGITFPQVCGSNIMNPRLEHQKIVHELYSYPNKGHETWGGLNGHFTAISPMDTLNWNDIIDKTSAFCYRYMQPPTPTITGATIACPNNTYTYQINNPKNSSKYCWTISNGSIVSQNNNASSVNITWNTNLNGIIKVREINRNVVESNDTTITVTIIPNTTPIGISIGTITANSINLSWDTQTGVSYEVAYKASDASNWNSISAVLNSATINNLISCTLYEFKVRAVCSASSKSNFSTPISAKTLHSTSLKVKAFLQGAFNGFQMTNTLQNLNLLPTNQPYSTYPWFYMANKNVNSFPVNTTDWVLIELRDINKNLIESQAALLLSDGNIVDTDNSANIKFCTASNGNYYIVLRHRNHLPIISNTTISLPNTTAYDFSTNINDTQQVLLANSTKKGMAAGDINANGIITFKDYNLYKINTGVTNQYILADCNLDGAVDINDYLMYSQNFARIGVKILRY